VSFYTKFSSERSGRYAVVTEIIKDNDKKYVLKRPFTDEAREHTERMTDICEKLRKVFDGTKFVPNSCSPMDGGTAFEYLDGPTLEEVIDDVLYKDKEAAKELLAEYISAIEESASEEFEKTEEFVRVFGNIDLNQGYKSNSVTDLDMVLSNIICCDDKWNIIDYEWTFDFPIPSKFVEWRAIYYFVTDNSGASKRSYLEKEGIFRLLNVSSSEMSKFKIMEENFQKYIRGEFVPAKNFYSDITEGCIGLDEMYEKAKKDRLTEKKILGRIFVDSGDGYKEIHREKGISFNGNPDVKISLENIKRVMIEPAELPVFMDIRGLGTDRGTVEIKQENVNGLVIGGDKLMFNCPDPKIVIDGWEEGSKELFISYMCWPLEGEMGSVLFNCFREAANRTNHYRSVIEVEQSELIKKNEVIELLKTTKPIRAYRSSRIRLGKGDPFEKLNPLVNSPELGIELYIDQKTYTKDAVFFRGWTFAKYAVDEQISFFDGAGKPVPADIYRTDREDVTKAFNIAKERKPGFMAEVKIADIGTLPLFIRISEPRGYVQPSIELELDEEKRRQRRLDIIEGRVNATAEDCIDYNDWFREYHCPSKEELERQRNDHFPYEPMISVVIPLYNTPLEFLKVICDSILGQTYSNVELCLADGSTKDEVGEFILNNYASDSRVVYSRLDENKGISENTNAAIALAHGEFIMLSDHDDEVTPDACYEIVKAINESDDVDVIYTDEDKVTKDGNMYYDPHFKPDFNLDLLRNNNYICHIFVVRRTTLDEAGLFRSEYDGAQDFDFILRMCEKARTIKHVPKILYHWRAHPASTAGNPESKMYAYENGKKAVQHHFDRLGIDAVVTRTRHFGRYRSQIMVKGEPLVSVIIPNRDHTDDLRRTIESVFDRTDYRNFEIIVIENGSTEERTKEYYREITTAYQNIRVVEYTEPFNYSAVNNFGVKYAKGDYLLFLNNDVEVISSNWMTELLSYCQLDNVGCVGARLLYPDNTIQHTGVLIGLECAAGHMFYGFDDSVFTYAGRGNSTQDLSAVTAACMMTKRSVFEEVGGFDEQFVVAFNDADYCLKVRQKDLLVVIDVYARLYHYESASRGSDKASADASKHARMLKEKADFKEKWSEYFENGDPYYNPNLDKRRTDFAFVGQYPHQEEE
jgi:GT2 family glycosyltransferase